MFVRVGSRFCLFFFAILNPYPFIKSFLVFTYTHSTIHIHRQNPQDTRWKLVQTDERTHKKQTEKCSLLFCSFFFLALYSLHKYKANGMTMGDVCFWFGVLAFVNRSWCGKLSKFNHGMSNGLKLNENV